MIIMYSDYNPDHAVEQLEDDGIEMLHAGFFLAGMETKWIEKYQVNVKRSSLAYESKLTKARLEVNYQNAIKAAKPYQDELSLMLDEAGITLVNTLMKPPRKDHHYFIQTKVYSEDDACNLVACINRPITDLEAKTYKNNIVGYGADRASFPIKHAPGEKPLTKKQKANVTKMVDKAVGRIGKDND